MPPIFDKAEFKNDPRYSRAWCLVWNSVRTYAQTTAICMLKKFKAFDPEQTFRDIPSKANTVDRMKISIFAYEILRFSVAKFI